MAMRKIGEALVDVSPRTPSKELRQAAATLRELAEETDRAHVPRFGAGTQVHRAWHDWWAIASPDLALPLAVMLEMSAARFRDTTVVDGGELESALTLARKINRHRDNAG